MGGLDDFDDEPQTTRVFDLAALAGQARPREVTGATFSYVDALLAGRMSQDDLARIKDDILGCGAPAGAVDPIAHVQRLISVRDDTGALHAVESILEEDPQHPEAHRLAGQCRARLGDLYQARLGPGHHVPRLAIDLEALGQLGIDRWAAYLISRLDGGCTIDELVDVGGFTRLDTLRVLYELVQRGIVAIHPGDAPAASRAPPASVLARVKLKRST